MILVCGEALYDVFVKENQVSEFALQAIVGGSPYNVALGLARQEHPCAFFSGIADDLLGRNLITFLNDEGVDTSLVSYKKTACSLSIIGLDDTGSPNYTFYGTGAADRILEQHDLPVDCTDFSIIHIGSYSTIVEPTGTTLLSLVKREADNCLISFDPNIRTNVEPDLKVWHQRIEELLPFVDLLKASSEDIQLLYPNEKMEDVAVRWLKSGPELVVITDGSEGAMALTDNSHIHIPGRKVQVVDTIGAGDTLQATILRKIDQLTLSSKCKLSEISKSDLTDILEQSVAAAALTCTRKGADLPTLSQINGID